MLSGKCRCGFVYSRTQATLALVETSKVRVTDSLLSRKVAFKITLLAYGVTFDTKSHDSREKERERKRKKEGR